MGCAYLHTLQDRVYDPLKLFLPRNGPEDILGADLRFPGVSMYPDDARLTAAEAAEWFNVTPAAVNNWFYRGRLKDVATDESGQRTFLFGELADVEAKTGRHPNSRRHRPRPRPQLATV